MTFIYLVVGIYSIWRPILKFKGDVDFVRTINIFR